MFRKIFTLVSILIIGSPFYLCAAEEWEVPVLSTTVSDTPNILFLQDNSGSMNCILQATEKTGYLPNSQVPRGADFHYSYDPHGDPLVPGGSYSRPGARRNRYGRHPVTGYAGSGWYMVGQTVNRDSIDASGNIAKRGRGFVWVYFLNYDYCERHWYELGGVNSIERRAGRGVPAWGTRLFDYATGSYWAYYRWLYNYARIRYIGRGRIYDIRGHMFDGLHYVVDLPRVNQEFNNDNSPGTPPFNTPHYNPLDYPPNKRMIPATLDDVTNDKGLPLLEPCKLRYRPYPEGAQTSVYEYWRAQPAVRAALAKFALCMNLQPEKYGLDPYPIDLKFGLMSFGSVHDGGRVLSECKSIRKTPGHILAIDRMAREMLCNTNTPLAEALWDAADYFRSEPVGPRGERFPSPIDSACQKNFVVYLTDGEPSADTGYHGAPLWELGNYDGDDINEACPEDRRSAHVPPGICNRKQRNYYWLGGGTDYLDDTAQYFYDIDLDKDWSPERKFPGRQNLVTYTIGLYVDYCMLKDAAEQTGGKYYPADDSEKLKTAFTEIVGDIVAKTQAGGAVAVCIVAAEETPESTCPGHGKPKGKDKMIRARFHPEGWRGYLDAFVIPEKYEDAPDWPQLALYDSDSKEDRVKKAQKNKELVEKYGSWRSPLRGFEWSPANTRLHRRGAHYLLRHRSPDTRSVFTYLKVGGMMRKVEFKEGNIDTGDPSLKSLLGAVNDTEAKNLINYIRGKEPGELVGQPRWRKRIHDYYEDWQTYLSSLDPPEDKGKWPLADIIFSAPTQKGAPNERYFCEDYIEFKKKYAERERMVYVGSNSMLHAFKVGEKLEDGGEEAWAYIPSNLLSRLKKLTQRDYGHLYYVDLTPVIKDIKIEDEWRTILIGGERVGGGVYFALDITGREVEGKMVVDYESVKVLWEYSDNGLGKSWSPPQIAKANSSGEVWACFMTSGPGKNDKDALYVLNAADGKLIQRIPIDAGNKDTWLTPPAGIDTNLDGTIDYVYAGDTQGNLWKFDLRCAKDPDNWSVSKLFACGSTQPITAKPTLAYGPHYEILVNFGTGRYETINDPPDKNQQTFYCLIDKKGGEIKKDELVDKTTDERNVPISPGKYGWYINLTGHTKKGNFAGSERVTKEALVYRGITIFTSFIPIDEACKAGGWAYLHAVVYSTGGKPCKAVMDVTDDMKVDEKDKITRCRALDTEAKDEVAVGVPSKPVIDERRDVVLVQTSMGGRVAVIKIDPPLQKVRIRTWREVS